MSEVNGKVTKDSIKLKVLKLKLVEDPLQYRIYFLIFVEYLGVIFHSTRNLMRYL